MWLDLGHRRKSCPVVWAWHGCREEVVEASCQHQSIMIPQGINIHGTGTLRVSQTVKGLRFLPFLQTNKLACRSFMDVGRRHETLSQKQRTLFVSK